MQNIFFMWNALNRNVTSVFPGLETVFKKYISMQKYKK